MMIDVQITIDYATFTFKGDGDGGIDFTISPSTASMTLKTAAILAAILKELSKKEKGSKK